MMDKANMLNTIFDIDVGDDVKFHLKNGEIIEGKINGVWRNGNVIIGYNVNINRLAINIPIWNIEFVGIKE